MTTIQAHIIADSISPDGIRLTTIHCRYPRFIHAEVMTHRVFSRNARSSRAVPVNTMLQEIIDDPVVPIHWGAAQKGMQAYQENDTPVHDPWRRDPLLGDAYISNKDAWLLARDCAVSVAKAFNEARYHKQVINRLLEPFMHIDTLISATEWVNFFALRDHHAAEPHIQKLAQVMRKAMYGSNPAPLKPGQWHLPYVSIEERKDYGLEICQKLSVARCARISYTPFDGNGDIESEIRRYDLLVGSHPIHASPAEHQGSPDTQEAYLDGTPRVEWRNPQLHGNLKGWIQLRKTLPAENITT